MQRRLKRGPHTPQATPQSLAFMVPFTSLGLFLSAFAFLRASAWNQMACESFTTLPSIPEDINATLTSTTWYAEGALFNETDPNTSLTSTDFSAFCRVQINITTSNASLSKSEIWFVAFFSMSPAISTLCRSGCQRTGMDVSLALGTVLLEVDVSSSTVLSHE